MKRLGWIAALLLLGVTTASAQPAGHWVGEGEGELEAKITHIEDERYAVSLSTLVPISDMGGCGGGIDGEALFSKKGGNFFVENEDYDPELPEGYLNTRYCEIAFSFTKDGKLTTEEVGGCGYYHGAACGFSGELTLVSE